MLPVTQIVLGGLLTALLLMIVALMLWQEAKRRGNYEARTYVISDAVRFVRQGLSDELKQRLGPSEVQRILEWEVYYLQGLAHPQPSPTVAGGSDEAVAFIVDGIAQRNKVQHTAEEVRAVLRLEAGYLASIGAVGDPVAGAERSEVS